MKYVYIFKVFAVHLTIIFSIFTGCSDLRNPYQYNQGSSCTASDCHGATVIGHYPPESGKHNQHLNSSLDIDCSFCHSSYDSNPLHKNRVIDGFNSALQIQSTGNVINFENGNPDSKWDKSSGTCSNLNCHGDAGWYSPDVQNCTLCHMPGSDIDPLLNGSHSVHLTGAGSFCNNCHNNYKENINHFNGIINTSTEADGMVNFSTVLNPDGGYDPLTSTCSSLVCHGDSLDLASQGTDTDPEWYDPSTGDCGTCHRVDSTLSAGSHSIHLEPPFSFTCDRCHEDNLDSDDHHFTGGMLVNGSVTISFDQTNQSGSYNSGSCLNTFCHGNFTGGNAGSSEPVWDGNVDCNTSRCHGVNSSGNPADSAIADSKHGTHVSMLINIENPATGSPYTEEETCSVCHSGHGYSTSSHVNMQVDISFDYQNPEGAAGSVISGGDLNTVTGEFNPVTCGTTYCHGNFSGGNEYTVNWTESTADSGWCGSCHTTSPTSVKHSEHLTKYTGECEYCHVGYTGTSAPPDHVSFTKDVVFGYSHPANTGGDPYYDNSTETCYNVYCHGNFPRVTYDGTPGVNPGNGDNPSWEDSSTAVCGSCHGNPDNNFSSVTHGGHTSSIQTWRSKPFFSNPLSIESCDACHNYGEDTVRTFGPDTTQGSYDSSVHADFSINNSGINSDINFKADNADLAAMIGPDTIVQAHTSWDEETTTCSNSWCHGNFDNFNNGEGITGYNASPNWLDPSTGACDTCHTESIHGIYGCGGGCHSSSGTFSEHINGSIGL